jgi:hypothetical protein
MVLKRLTRTGRLFAFLRRQRGRLFNEAFQQELLAMYSDAPRGTAAVPPAMLAMVTLLQAYERKSDAAAVEEAVFDRRWQMVLDCMGTTDAPFSQGVLVDFRRRLVAHDMDRRLLERTVELARETGDFGEKALKVALDSSPLWGAGRVEDTFNLIGHALEVVVDCAAAVLKTEAATVRREAKLQLLGGPSLKSALDIDWDDSAAKTDALQRLLAEVQRMRAWLAIRLKDALNTPPLKEALELLERVLAQDLEPDPGGGMRIRDGVAKDRRISVSDKEMRHGRKSKSRVINGFKRHVAIDVEAPFILAACVRPANEPEHHAADLMRASVEELGTVVEFHIDRGYLASTWAREVDARGDKLVAKPWPSRNGQLFAKTDFQIDLSEQTVTCPAERTATIRTGKAQFAASDCDACPLRALCTRARLGRGRSIAIHEQEELLLRLRQLKSQPAGRRELRKRVAVEHSLAHVSRRQGVRARYRGVRMNTLDVRRVAAVENLHRLDAAARAA